MSYIIRKTFSIAMGHILEDAYTKKCCQLHGHTYTIELELCGESLDKDKMIADYTYVKDIFNMKKFKEKQALENTDLIFRLLADISAESQKL